MKIMHPLFEKPIEFEENSVEVLVIENPRLLTKTVLELSSGAEGGMCDFVFSKDNKEIAISKNIIFIRDVFSCDVNNRKNITKLYSLLSENAAEDEMYLKTNELIADIYKYIGELTDKAEFMLEFKEPEVSELLKICNVQFEKNGESLLEKICEYILIMSRLAGISLFVFLNLKVFLEDEELFQLYKFAGYNKIFLLLLESANREPKLDGEKTRIIDKDLCEIY